MLDRLGEDVGEGVGESVGETLAGVTGGVRFAKAWAQLSRAYRRSRRALLMALHTGVRAASSWLQATLTQAPDYFRGTWRDLRAEGVAGVARRAWHFFSTQSFSSQTRRIVFLNVAGLVIFVIGILYLTQFRAGLIDARVQSLKVQGEIISSAIAASATADTESITIDPDRLLNLQAGQSYGPDDDVFGGTEFSINPDRAAPLLLRLISPTKTRARLYDEDGALILDSRGIYERGNVLQFDLQPPNAEKPGFFERAYIEIRTWLGRGDLPRYRELGTENGKGYPEVAQALAGQPASVVSMNDHGDVIVSVAVPVQHFRAVHGALLLSTQGGEIDQIVEAERLAIVKVFLIAAAVMALLSLLFAGTIAGPVRRLAAGAESVRQRVKSRVEIPDFTRRHDEIGHLSRALRDMTNSLYSRIEAIESFAADVAHELKNPLTSLRSAVETMPLAKSDDSRRRLLGVIEHDVRRLDRLISDISDASRLDADLLRHDAQPVDLMKLLNAVVDINNEVQHEDGVRVTASFEGGPRAFTVRGHDSRLGQVIDNLIANARSFSPADGNVRVTCRRLKADIEIVVDDDGPGIRPEALTKIFQRFYTDRPHQGFGQNSGLGLSISKQIVEAHQGTMWAENRMLPGDPGQEPRVTGARFVVRLPAM